VGTTITPEGDALKHFTARAERYDRSSHWCTDPVLADRVLALTEPGPTDHVLDVACGTGLVSRLFKGRAGRVVGADITRAMYEQAKPYLDELVETPAESLPFEDNSFDIVVCRQGTQFMDDSAAVKEMVRVAKPGGRILIVNLCAYGDEDREEYFEILRLRNPARCNFYMREDLERLLTEGGCSEATVHDHISVEDVDAWSDNGAIEESRREGIRAVYRDASKPFSALHAVATEDGDRFVDNMLFGLALGIK